VLIRIKALLETLLKSQLCWFRGQSNCGAYELLFWEVAASGSPPASGKPPPLPTQQTPTKAVKTRDADWLTWTCILGWPVQGIWTGTMDGSDVNAVCRIDGAQKFLAVAGDDGKVKLYNYPCISNNAGFVEGTGHSSHVTNVRYMTNGTHVTIISTGGNDKCVFQRRMVPV
jgi:lipoxygenase homology domain-containing protein 1